MAVADADGHRAALELGPGSTPVHRVGPAADMGVLWVAPGAGTGPVSCSGESCRLAVEYTGYTWFHLPVRDCSAPLLRNAEAILAILAARMAFSSRWTRSRLR